MSYLSFLHIQCSMGYDETEIIKYVIFGEREELAHLPPCEPSIVVPGIQVRTELRPLYLFWDKTDERVVRLYESFDKKERGRCGSALGKAVSSIAVKYMQNKYKEVFLSQPETLFLSEKAQKEIPGEFWQTLPNPQIALHHRFGEREVLGILASAKRKLSLLIILPQECVYDELETWLLRVEELAGVYLGELFLLGMICQKERGEDVLDAFYEQTGLAGSFYPLSEYRKLMSMVGNRSILLDYAGLPVKELGRPVFYVDGAGVRTRKELQRMGGVCEACRSLRNHLDRAFLSAL